MAAGTVVILAFDGPLTSLVHPHITADALMARIQVTRPRIVLNLEAVPRIDCSGIGLLVALHRASGDVHGDVRLVKACGKLRKTLETCGLTRFISCFDTEEDALKSIVATEGPEICLERTSSMPFRDERVLAALQAAAV
jgi:anti-anti-sigma factor